MVWWWPTSGTDRHHGFGPFISLPSALAWETAPARLAGQLRFPEASWVAHTAQKGAMRANAFDKPTISSFRTGRQEIAAVLGMLAAIPSLTVLALHA